MATKRMGRPPLDPEQAKSAIFQLRLAQSERDEYERSAERAGLKLSAWIRDRLSKCAKRELK